MTTTIRPTREALRVHRSHLATTHRAPLVPRHAPTPGARPTSFIPMAREPLSQEPLSDETHAAETPRDLSAPDQTRGTR